MSTAEGLRAQIKALTSEIKQHQARLEEMKSHLHALQEQLHAIPYPVLSLPPEIIAHIFEYTPVSGMNTWRRVAPTLFTQVCHTWREIAVTTPTLWSSFSIWIHERTGWRGLAHLAEMWFSRAGNVPLHVDVHGDMGWTQATGIPAFLGVLERYSPRIGHLRLGMATHDLAMLDTYSFNWQRLVSLKYSLTYEGRPTNSPRYKLFHTASSLRSVEFNSMLPSFFDLPWSNVDHFDGFSYSCRDTLQIMEQLPNTTSFELVTSTYEDARRTDPRPVEYTNVHKFLITEQGQPHPEAHILEFFTFPQLETLELGSEIDGDALSLFLTRSAAPLRRLVLTGGEVFNSLEVDVLKQVPSLVELELRSPTRWLYREFIFNEYPDDMGFLPQLEKLSISCALRDEITMDDLVGDVGAELMTRKKKLAQLGGWTLKALSLYVEVPDTMRYIYPERSLAVYKELREGGLEVSIRGRYTVVF